MKKILSLVSFLVFILIPVQWLVISSEAFQHSSAALRPRHSKLAFSSISSSKTSWSTSSISKNTNILLRKRPSAQVLFSTETSQQQQHQQSDLIPSANTTTSIEISSTNATKGDAVPTTSSGTYPETPSLRECLAFALPALGIYACPPLMSLIDATFIGRLSSSIELAALGPASSISDSSPLPLLFLSIAATNLIAKSHSQNDTATSVRVAKTALGMGTVCGIFLAILLYTFATPVSVLYCGGGGGSGSLAPACAKYVAIRALALPAVVISIIAQAVCIGTKDTKTPMISVALAGGLNLMGDFILVKWLGKGIAGAAWATSASQFLSAALLVRALKRRGLLDQQKVESSEKEDSSTNNAPTTTTTTTTLGTVKQLLSFLPFLYVMAVKIFWHNSNSATAASLGGPAAAAHTALLSVGMLCFVLGDVGSSLSQAFLPAFVHQTPHSTKTSNISEEYGEEDSSVVVSSKPQQRETTVFDLDAAIPTIKQLLKCTLSISATVVGLAAVVIGLFGTQITSDPAVFAEMRKTLPWVLTALSFHGSAVTLEGFLLARKKLKGLTVCYSILAITVAAFQVATKTFNLGLAGVWGCYVWFCASRVITFSALGGLLHPRRWLQRTFARIQEKRRR